jgi:hypothetical protein
MEIQRLMALESSYEEGFAQVGTYLFILHIGIITEFTASIVAVVGSKRENKFPPVVMLTRACLLVVLIQNGARKVY